MHQEPTLILGTAMWGWTMNKALCFELLDAFYAAGLREVDGATNYPINKQPEDFRKSEKIIEEWITAHGVTDLQVMMKVGSLNNMRTPDHNLQKSFLLLMLDEYRNMFGNNLDTFMLHWDNREDRKNIESTYEALQSANQLGLRVGLSGIKHPKVHAAVNQAFNLDFRIQMKHNLLYSDCDRYADFHGSRRFITYGINAGGIKLDPADYHNQSSLRVRGGTTDQPHPIAQPLQNVLNEYNQLHGTNLSTFNNCGMTYAFHSPDIQGILLGTSSLQQMKGSIAFYKALKAGTYQDLYLQLQQIAQTFQNN